MRTGNSKKAVVEKSSAAANDVSIGLRERGKRERLRRIKEAAFDVFRSEGYENATTREIARLADVSVGTLFVYARDKRDLLFLVMNEDLDRICDDSTARALMHGSAIEGIVTLLAPIYDYFAKEPDLARVIIAESARADVSPTSDKAETARYAKRLGRWRNAIAAILDEAGKSGDLELGDDAATLARAVFAVHLAEVRDWLTARKPLPRTGVAELENAVRAILSPRARKGKM